MMTTRITRSLFIAFAVSLMILPATAAERQHTGRPNILLIMADDLGFSDLGCYGSEIQTPHLDSIAQNGLRFTQFYNTARCWPTRAALMTGYYAQQIRRDTLPNIPSGGGNRGRRPDWAVLLPKLLKPAGYRSYHTGKWHIDGMPLQNGFDHSYYLRDQGRFFNPKVHWKDDVKLPPVEKGTDFYATTALADHVIDVLQDHAQNHADAPFFHYLAFAAPHFPLHALPQDIAVYNDTYTAGWDAIRAQRWRRQQQSGLLEKVGVSELSRVERELGPPYHFPDAFPKLGAGEINKPVPWNSLNATQKQFQAAKMAIHAAMIHRMDMEIGRVFEQIRKMGQWDNTLVIFLSDNGASAEIMVRDDGHDPNASPGSAATYLCLGPGWSTVCNTPFRRHKTWTHEGGISTPLLMAWPNGIAAKGEIRRRPGHVIDIVPTLLELTGTQPLPDAPTAPGTSLVPVLTQDGLVRNITPARSLGRNVPEQKQFLTRAPHQPEATPTDATHVRPTNTRQPVQPGNARALWWFHDGNKAIRMGNWKAVAPVAEPWELYDLAGDRDESTDLAVPRADKLAELVTEWDRQLSEITELAMRDLAPEVQKKTTSGQRRPDVMKTAQAAAKPKRRQVLINGKSFLLNGRHAFTMTPKQPATTDGGKPWIFYGPTLNAYPDKAESWMHQQFLDAGIAVAGIDVGEAYGSPHTFAHFEALYQYMVKHGYSAKPALLGRSRGGLWVSSWALKHPDRVAGIGGIYPVYDYTTYPGVERAATAYGLSADELLTQQNRLNPIKRATTLAAAKIPVFIIHGRDDKVVPLAANSEALENAYRTAGAEELIEVLKIDGQGHSFWPGFFHCQELVDFLIARAHAK